MKKVNIASFLIIFICSSILCNSRFQNVAFCLDSKGNVLREGRSRNGKVYKGDIIYNGDKLTVSLGGLLTIRNIYERSEIKIFENSSVKIFTRKISH